MAGARPVEAAVPMAGFLVRLWRWLDRQVDVMLAEHREMIEQSWPVGDDVSGAPAGGRSDTGPVAEPPPST